MAFRFTRCLLIVSVLFVWSEGWPAALAEGWSLPNPFASDTKTKNKSQSKKSVHNTSKQKTSFLGEIGAGTKQLFTNIGNTITGKKPEPKKRITYATPVRPTIQHPQKEKTSWFGSMFQSQEPEKPKTVKDWMQQERVSP